MHYARFTFSLSVITSLLFFGCAQGSDSIFGDEGEGGAGGAGGETASSTTASSGSTTSSTSASSTTSGTTTSTSSGGPECADDQHLCGGVCTGNTTQTGCFTSVTCAPCASPPINGTSTCSADGKCDFTCNSGYAKSGNSCVCAAECCSNADCPGGGTCQGGVCGAPPCDQAACIIECFAMFCVGICIGDTCTCMC